MTSFTQSPAMSPPNEELPSASFSPSDFFGDDTDMAVDSFSPAGNEVTLPEGIDDELGAILGEGGNANFDLNKINEDPIVLGEKAEGAIDYEDISDDDLPEEEMTGGPVQEPGEQLAGILDFAADDDDLFGDGGPSSPAGVPDISKDPNAQRSRDEEEDLDLASDHDESFDTTFHDSLQDMNEEDAYQFRIQQALFAQIGKAAPATEQENIEEWVKHDFPAYDRNEIPYFHKLFPPKPSQFNAKTPLKPPKPVKPTKINLEIAPDQRVAFNSNAPSKKRPWEGDETMVVISRNEGVSQIEDDSAEESDLGETLPGGLLMQDLDVICADFETLSEIAESQEEAMDMAIRLENHDAQLFGLDAVETNPAPKKQKLGLDPHEIVSSRIYEMPSFDNPEKLASRISRKVVLDLDDPHILVEEVRPDSVRVGPQNGTFQNSARTVKDMLQDRFNHSNDAEYELLKQNHQHKIRSNLANRSIEHSLPALRLQYPYYKVKLDTSEARKFHRRPLHFKSLGFQHFEKKNTKIKRKHLKGKKAKEIFLKTGDLSTNDGSTVMLFEYSEEHPMVLSQTGMGVKIINYYRRRTRDDSSRPKSDIGETEVLLPEDKSPFSLFGHIGPGETVKALYNSMYRAPIFEQEPHYEDFLVERRSTGMDGSSYSMRNFDHLCVVGQEFPSVTVPGPHSRVVTTTSKNRLKTISYRIIRRKKNQRLRVEDVTKHFPDTTDMQNRQKMKEFMSFSKEHKEWEMKPDDMIPDEDFIQSLITPENICLLDSMQVGQQYLHDAGYGQEDDSEEEEMNEDENQTIEQELAPWKTSKNFINATQGKAMLKLYGQGDPSGRGEAFSFIKTSMKGGFKAMGESAMDKIAEKKELGGHSYNVQRQQRMYEDSIRRIWDAQKASLSSAVEHSDNELEGGVEDAEDNPLMVFDKPTPRSQTATPAPYRRRDDESMTSFSRHSNTSQSQKVLRIMRTVRKGGREVTEEYVERDSAVIKQYKRRRNQMDAASSALADALPTGDAEYDARQRKRLEDELARLEKNKDRRLAREKAKGISSTNPDVAGSPDADGAGGGTGKTQGTQRKCANCGQVGHIKTNKKLCPLLNGTIKQEDGFNNAAFMGAPPSLA